MIKTILVTGGGGFIGSHILESLLAKGYNVIVLERTPESLRRIENLVPKIKVYFSSKNDLGDIFQENKIDCVLHLAALYIKDHSSIEDVDNIVDANIKFPAQLAELSVKYGIKLFINTGSLFEYGIVKAGAPIKEGDTKSPLSLYACSKVSCEEILRYYSRDKNLKVANMLLFSPFGDGDNEKLFAYLIKSLIHGEEIDFSGGEQRWNFTYVEDIALAYLRAIENAEKVEGFEEFNVGYDKDYSLKEIVAKLENISGKKMKINWGAKPYVKNEYMYFNCDNSKIRQVLNWQPEHDFDYGLEKTYKYYLDFYKKENNG